MFAVRGEFYGRVCRVDIKIQPLQITFRKYDVRRVAEHGAGVARAGGPAGQHAALRGHIQQALETVALNIGRNQRIQRMRIAAGVPKREIRAVNVAVRRVCLPVKAEIFAVCVRKVRGHQHGVVERGIKHLFCFFVRVDLYRAEACFPVPGSLRFYGVKIFIADLGCEVLLCVLCAYKADPHLQRDGRVRFAEAQGDAAAVFVNLRLRFLCVPYGMAVNGQPAVAARKGAVQRGACRQRIGSGVHGHGDVSRFPSAENGGGVKVQVCRPAAGKGIALYGGMGGGRHLAKRPRAGQKDRVIPWRSGLVRMRKDLRLRFGIARVGQHAEHAVISCAGAGKAAHTEAEDVPVLVIITRSVGFDQGDAAHGAGIGPHAHTAERRCRRRAQHPAHPGVASGARKERNILSVRAGVGFRHGSADPSAAEERAHRQIDAEQHGNKNTDHSPHGKASL